MLMLLLSCRKLVNHRNGGGALAVLVNNHFMNVSECTFENNSATSAGGAIFFEASNFNVNIESSRFIDNAAKQLGGSLYFGEEHDFTTLRGVRVSGSQSRDGAGES